MPRVIICFSTWWHADISAINLRRRSGRRLVITSHRSAFSILLMERLVNCQHTHTHVIGDNYLHTGVVNRVVRHQDGCAAIFIRAWDISRRTVRFVWVCKGSVNQFLLIKFSLYLAGACLSGLRQIGACTSWIARCYVAISHVTFFIFPAVSCLLLTC